MSSNRVNHDFTSLLITGEMRSGTTLLANFLNSQPYCTVYADLLKGWFNEPKKLGIQCLADPLSDRQKNVLLSSLVAAGWQFGISSFEGIDRQSFGSWLELYRQGLRALDKGGDAQVIGVKITRQYEWVPQLLDHGVRVVFCLRDPRDVLLSAKNRFSDYNLYERTLAWREGLRFAESLRGRAGFLIVRFEDLLDERARSVKVARLSELLGVTLTANLESLVIRDGVSFGSNSAFGDVERLFDPRARFRWKEHVASPEVTLASAFLRKEIESLGYEPWTAAPTDYRPLQQALRVYAARRRLKRALLRLYRLVLG